MAGKTGGIPEPWDFRLLEPEYMKVAGKYQLAMYQGYFDYYQTIGMFFDRIYRPEGADTNNKPQETKPEDNMQELLDKYQESLKTNRKLYNQAFDDGIQVKDWRKIFAQVPEPDC